MRFSEERRHTLKKLDMEKSTFSLVDVFFFVAILI